MLKNSNTKYILFCLLINIGFKGLSQTNWPFPTNQQGAITGTIGEHRGTTGRFHLGTDITNGNELSVHAITDGNVTFNNGGGNWAALSSWVRVGNIYYKHVKPIAGIINRTITHVNAGDHIGEMIVETGFRTHIHLEGNTNYLNQNLSPYIDRAVPYFGTGFINTGVALYKNGLLKTTTNYNALLLSENQTVNGIVYRKIYNKVDIAAHVIDPQTNSGGNANGGQCAPFRINWKLKTLTNVIAVEDQLIFDNVPIAASYNFVFHPQASGTGNPSIHIITSNPRQAPYDRYLNTNLLGTNTESWPSNESLDAQCNLVSRTPDGLYYIEVQGFDVDYDANPNNQTPIERVDVLLDNFRPFIQKVEARKNTSTGPIVYLGEWSYGGGHLSFTASNPSTLTEDEAIYLTITSSEPMQSMQLIAFGQAAKALTKVGNGKQWTTTYTASQILPGNQTFEFPSSCVDLAGNPIEGYDANHISILDAEIPQRQNNGTWLPLPTTGSDTKHRINVSSSINNIDFTYTPNYGAFPLAVQFNDITVADVNGWEWDFHGEGTANSTTIKNPKVTYATPGEKSVSLKLFKNGQFKGEVNRRTITISNNLFADFSVDKTSGAKPLVVKFENKSSSNATSFRWFFDDGSTSTEKSPTHTFIDDGNYRPILTAIDINGKEETCWNGAEIFVSNSNITISGKIEEQIGFKLIPDVQITFEGLGDTYTDHNGHYSYNVPYQWSGYVKPFKKGYNINTIQIKNAIAPKTVNFIGFNVGDFQIVMDLENPNPGDLVEVSATGVPWDYYHYTWEIKKNESLASGANGSTLSTSGHSTCSFYFPTCNTFYDQYLYAWLTIWDDNGNYQNLIRYLGVVYACPSTTTASAPLYGNETTVKKPFILQDRSEPYDREIAFQVHWNFPNNEITYCTPHGKTSGLCGHPNTYGNDRIVDHLYPTKGRYTYRTWSMDASYNSPEKWGGVVVVNCDETTTQSNLQNAVYDDWANIHQYYSGSFSLGDLPISGQNNQKIVFKACNSIKLTNGFSAAPTAGNYLKIIANYEPLQEHTIAKAASINDTCIDESVLADIVDLNVSQFIEIYPNPTTGNFTIDFGQVETPVSSIEVLNLTGRLILEISDRIKKNEIIDIQTCPQGVYFIRMIIGNDIIVKKIVKI